MSVNLYANFVIVKVCTKFPKINILEITLSFTKIASINPIEKLIYERLDEEISTYDERDKKAAYIYYHKQTVLSTFFCNNFSF